MQKFQFVEDYLEVIGGYRDPQTGKTVNHSNFWFNFTPIISLARYDVGVLDSMCDTAIQNKALTTKQGELAVKIITKYNRQLAQKGVDVSPLQTPQWRSPLRVLDYTRRMYIKDDKIMLEFPFKNELIDGLREFRKDSQGGAEWNKEKKRWEFALTEYNLVYLKTWAETNLFEIDSEVSRLNQIIEDTEKTGYAIELDFIDNKLTIKNANQTLIDYINTNCGGFDYANLAKLIDMAPVLGYTVNPGIQQAWVEEHGLAVEAFTLCREIKVNTEKYDMAVILSSVIKYAEATNRYPVVFFEPDLKNVLRKELSDQLGYENIKIHKLHHNIDSIDQSIKYIHTTAPIKDLPIPLLVSTAGMMFGGDKSLMLQNTEKVIYFAADVYTNKKDNKVPEFESQSNNS